jgi:hypothetical protein
MRQISSSKPEGKEYVREWEYKKERKEKKSLTSSEETAEAWASRETSASLVFFARLRFRV